MNLSSPSRLRAGNLYVSLFLLFLVSNLSVAAGDMFSLNGGYVALLLLGGVLSVVLWRNPLGQILSKPPRSSEWFYIAFLCICFASMGYSSNPFESFERSFAFTLVLLVVMRYMDFMVRFRESINLRSAVVSIHWAFAVPIFLGVLLYFVNPDVVMLDVGYGFTRYKGLFENPNTCGCLSFLLIALAAPCLLTKRSMVGSALYVSSVCVGVMSLLFTGSRAAIVATGLFCLCYGVLAGWKAVLRASVILPCVSLLLLVPSVNEYFVNQMELLEVRSGAGLLVMRTEQWRAAIEDVSGLHFLVGHGAASRSEVYEYSVDNTAISAFYELGIIGAGLLFSWLIGSIVGVIKNSRACSKEDRLIRVAIISVMVGVVVHSLGEDLLYSPVSPVLQLFAFLSVLGSIPSGGGVKCEGWGEVNVTNAPIGAGPSLRH